VADAGQEHRRWDFGEPEGICDVRGGCALPPHNLDALAIQLLAHAKEVIGADPEQRSRGQPTLTDRDFGKDTRSPRDGDDLERAAIAGQLRDFLT
jgi:hypothetical protein